MSKKEETTNVSQVEVDIDELLGVGTDTVMLADESNDTAVKEDTDKKSIFAPLSPDLSFLDKPENKSGNENKVEAKADTTEDKEEETVAENATTETSKEEVADFLDAPEFENEVENSEDDKKKGGRPTALVSATKNLIENGLLNPFRDDNGDAESIENYTAEDFEELIKVNLEHKSKELEEKMPEQFFKNMPREMQEAYAYIAEGGTDIKSMFSALSTSVEVAELDPGKEPHQKQIIRTYLNATNYGTPEEIEDELYSLEDRGDLEKKANQFKPKLDKMQQQIVADKIARQQEEVKQRQASSQMYIDSVYSTLEKGELNGLKLDTQTQNMLYSGLVQSNYSSMNGNGYTNMLGNLLEKYQWGTKDEKPRHDLIAEALWLLADPSGYKSKLKEDTEKQTHEKTLRTLKTEQSSKNISSSSVKEEKPSSRSVSRGIPRPKRNFFGR